MPLPQTEMPGRLQAHFADRGIRMTDQRRAILRVMETASKHLDAAQLLRKAQKLDASVDRSTVYRTLQLLKRHGLIDELDLMHIHGEGHYYERKLNRDHIHMACLRCGKIMEGTGGKRLPVPDRGFATGNWRVLRVLFEVTTIQDVIEENTGTFNSSAGH
jgi:Fe2+ or Zn2+ uptake regulation protein